MRIFDPDRPRASLGRILLAASLLLLAACSDDEDSANALDPLVSAEREARARAAENGRAYCALDGAANVTPQCTLEQSRSEEGLILTLRHPDGGFRRLLVTRDGRGVIAADGAEEAIVRTVTEREIEVEIGRDRYRLPATVR